MYRKSMLRLIISTSILLIFLPSQSIASDWRDTLKALKNEVIKNVPSVSGVMGTNLKCERKGSFFAENHILIYIHEGYNYFYIKSIIEAIRSFRNQIKLKG